MYDRILEKIPAWGALTGCEPPVTALHNQNLETREEQILLSKFKVCHEKIMASVYQCTIVMSLFITSGRRASEKGEDELGCRGGGRLRNAHPSDTEP